VEDLVLISKIHSTLLYETWEVLKQEAFGKKPYLAHIFRYTLSNQFPLKKDNLEQFCEKIVEYNNKMKSKANNFRALPCYNSTVFSQKTPGGVLSYLLFEKPTAGFKLTEMCTPMCAKDRVCKYMMKDFAKGYIDSYLYSQASSDAFDVNFYLAQNGFFYGKVPTVKKGLKKQEGLAMFQNNNNQNDNKEDPLKHFVTLAYPKAYSPETVKGPSQNMTSTIKTVKNKQMMVYFGKFLINMYKGLDNSTNFPAPTPEDNFNPRGFNFKNLTEVYLNLNTGKNGNFTKFRADEYFGVKPNYVVAVRAFLGKTLTSQKAFKEMDALLKNSFYEFIYKSVMFDPENKKQFEDMNAMLGHKFLANSLKTNQLRSDTSFDDK